MPRFLPALALSLLLAGSMGCAFFVSWPDTTPRTPAEWAAVTRPLDAQGVAHWREAETRILHALEKKHPNPWFRLPEADFQRQVADLDRDLPRLTERQVVLRWKLILASLGDEHTSLWEQETGAERWPVAVGICADGVLVTDASSAYRDLLGARVVAVGGMPIEAFLRRLDAFGAASIPAYGRLRAAERFPFGWLWLNALGQLPAGSQPTIEVVLPDGHCERRTITPVARPARVGWTHLPTNPGLLRYADPDRQYTYRLIEGNRTLYVRYRACENQKGGPSVWRFTGQVERAAAEAHPRRLIVDLRGNEGGNSFLFERMLHWIRATPAFSRPGGLLVLTDAGTFSSAFLNALSLQRAGGRLIGAPSGQPLNAYGDIRFTSLPGLRPVLACSTKTFLSVPGDPAAWHRSLTVDVPVPVTRGDLLGQTDTALVIALKQPCPKE